MNITFYMILYKYNKLNAKGVIVMIDSSITHCSNDNCSKKVSCLRYANKRDVKYGQT